MTAVPTWALFAIAVLVWGTTWHAILYQLPHVAPEMGVAIRFVFAGALVLGFAAWRGLRIRVGARVQLWLALQGASMFGLSYIAVYHAERFVPSGLVAVGYSASPLINGIAAAWLWGAPLSRRFLVGGVLGVVGVAAVFWPELAGLSGDRAVWGAWLTVAALVLSSVGNLIAVHLGRQAAPFWPCFGWAMLWGGASAGVCALMLGQRFEAPASLSFWLSLGYLALAGSIVAFAAFLTLQQRIGTGRAATIGVMTPLLALAVSTALEGYRPNAWTLVGVALAVLGNALMLRRVRA